LWGGLARSRQAPFGVDLLLPKVGEGARATNKDYTEGRLPELLDIVIRSGARLFVSAVGVPPRWAVDRLHGAGILVMNMVGAPKHVAYALAAGVDLICAQGGEGGGHTGDVATSILIPAVVDLCRGHLSPLTHQPIHVVAAGGIVDGRGLAMALALGAQAAWVGTRFICSTEAGAPKRHQEAVIQAGCGGQVGGRGSGAIPSRSCVVIINEAALGCGMQVPRHGADDHLHGAPHAGAEHAVYHRLAREQSRRDPRAHCGRESAY
jgi:hypothetical protein